jgi:plasmid stability protein
MGDLTVSRKPSETVQLKLRFPEKLRQRIESAAARNKHSMNAEIVHRLEQSFQKDDAPSLAEAAATTTLQKLDVTALTEAAATTAVEKWLQKVQHDPSKR